MDGRGGACAGYAQRPIVHKPETTAATLPGTTSTADSKTAAGGFTEVSGLRKDRDGMWRGQTMRDGTSVSFFCDDRGNVGAS